MVLRCGYDCCRTGGGRGLCRMVDVVEGVVMAVVEEEEVVMRADLVRKERVLWWNARFETAAVDVMMRCCLMAIIDIMRKGGGDG